EYQNAGYGAIKVGLKGDALELSLNKLGPYPLEYYHYDIFQVPEDSDSFAAGEKFQFEMNKKGDIDRIAAPLAPALGEDIIFTRAPEKISQDVLQKLAGDYLLADQTVTFAVAGDVLRLTLPGQPVYELIPRKELSFDLKGLPGFSVDFQMDASGKVTEAVFNQPNGVFHAKRK
ncbi:MAG: serine hydrolase, partial [Acidobacteria bacterium]